MSTSDTTNALLTANDQLSAFQALGRGKTAEGGLQFPRGSSYGETVMQSLMGAHTPLLAAEGSYWTASNVPGTPITNAIVTGFVATTPTLVLFNSNPVGGKSIYPVRFKTQIVAAGTTSSDFQGQILVDTGNRKTSGGTVLTAASPNLNVLNTATGAIITMGAITAPAANASRIIHAQKYRSVIKVASDRYTWEFGGSVPVAQGAPLEGTLQVDMVIQVAPVCLPPQCSLILYTYGTAMGTADSMDFSTFEYVER